jgi:hypothetical protein
VGVHASLCAPLPTQAASPFHPPTLSPHDYQESPALAMELHLATVWAPEAKPCSTEEQKSSPPSHTGHKVVTKAGSSQTEFRAGSNSEATRGPAFCCV